MTLNVDGKIPSLKSHSSVRLVSFNINGYKTLTHYHPWNDLSTLSKIFTYLKADIITFQELKLQKQDIDRSIACVPNYRTFITIPQKKKGYSGVSIFIKSNIQILKVEEGITGYLLLPNNQSITYRENYNLNNSIESSSIGGYTDNLNDSKEALSIDQDGRCLIIELYNNIVIICVYCPANSMLDEDMEILRCLFLETLFKRVENLSKMGKSVIIMGDINVSPSLIDRDDYINEGLKDKSLIMPNSNSNSNSNISESFEILNKDAVLNFRSELMCRKILNTYVYDINNFNQNENNSKILYDLGRVKNPNRLKMYTCWNTLKNNRPLNIGSRIDLFLATKDILNITDDCNIWPFLYGSDHCPIFCDLDFGKLKILNPISNFKPSYKNFEAVTYYGLTITKSIDSFFKLTTRSKSEPSNNNKTQSIKFQSDIRPEKRNSRLPVYTSRKIQKGQSTLFSSIVKPKESLSLSSFSSSLSLTPASTSDLTNLKDSLFVQDSDDDENDDKNNNNNNNSNIDEKSTIPKEQDKNKLSAATFNELLTMRSFNSVPQCDHNEPCVLRTTRNGVNTGRKFWCCSKPKENSTWSDDLKTTIKETSDNNEYSCSYFKWAQK
ncbi:Class II abasic (AP) endonuclease [Pichia californica]|uniref:DNA-(apurinic or apyrimidinic site) endonuclease 2 n=1 Tax=Pichia californica TaxID=460514 RepID=A0A9P7BIE3_9ASCO|nr:Class II abasic (AP) endonuclease [[Candida] californica]KAG0690873.1 Class II abasic (AP) endonuclease [[Candida] californica]